jgi:hypothetical protein
MEGGLEGKKVRSPFEKRGWGDGGELQTKTVGFR